MERLRAVARFKYNPKDSKTTSDFQPTTGERSSAIANSGLSAKEICGEDFQRSGMFDFSSTLSYNKFAIRKVPNYENKTDAELDAIVNERLGIGGLHLTVKNHALLCVTASGQLKGRMQDDGNYYDISDQSKMTKQGDQWNGEVRLWRDVKWDEIPQEIKDIHGADTHLSPKEVYKKFVRYTFIISDQNEKKSASGSAEVTLRGNEGLNSLLPDGSIVGPASLDYTWGKDNREETAPVSTNPSSTTSTTTTSTTGISSEPTSRTPAKTPKTLNPKQASIRTNDGATPTAEENVRLSYSRARSGEFKPKATTWDSIRSSCGSQGQAYRFPVKTLLDPKPTAEQRAELQKRAQAQGKELKLESYAYFVYVGLCVDPETNKLRGGICVTGRIGVGRNACTDDNNSGKAYWDEFVSASLNPASASQDRDYSSFTIDATIHRTQEKTMMTDIKEGYLMLPDEKDTKSFPHALRIRGTLRLKQSPHDNTQCPAILNPGTLTSSYPNSHFPWLVTSEGAQDLDSLDPKLRCVQ